MNWKACKASRVADSICVTKDCQAHAFMCDSDKCECHTVHSAHLHLSVRELEDWVNDEQDKDYKDKWQPTLQILE